MQEVTSDRGPCSQTYIYSGQHFRVSERGPESCHGLLLSVEHLICIRAVTNLKRTYNSEKVWWTYHDLRIIHSSFCSSFLLCPLLFRSNIQQKYIKKHGREEGETRRAKCRRISFPGSPARISVSLIYLSFHSPRVDEWVYEWIKQTAKYPIQSLNQTIWRVVIAHHSFVLLFWAFKAILEIHTF